LEGRGLSHRELEQQGFQTLDTAVEYEGTGVRGDIEAREAW